MLPKEILLILGLLRCILVHILRLASYLGRVGGETRDLGIWQILRHKEKHRELTQSITAWIAFSIAHGAHVLEVIHAELVVCLQKVTQQCKWGST